MERVIIPYKPRPLQAEYHKEKKRWNLLVCHRRFGKTVMAINDLIKAANTHKLERPRFGYIAPFYKQAKSIAWDYIKHYSSPIPGVKFNESELRVDYPNGARISLFGGDNPDSMRGLYFDGVVLDEYAQMSPRLFTEIVRPALSDREGWATFIGSAKGGTIFHDLFEVIQFDQKWYVKVYKASETDIILSDELEDARKIMDEDEYNQEYECSWTASVKGAYYGKQLLEAEKRIIRVPYEESLPVSTYWDLGVGDATTIWFAQFVGNEIRFIDYEEHEGEGLPFYAKLLQDKGYVYGEHIAPHDIQVRELGSGESRINIAKKLGIRFKIAPNLPVDDGINAARLIFSKCWFDEENCKEGILALRNYRKEYDDKRKTYKDRPLHDWASHGADAFRYFAVSQKAAKKQREKRQPQIAIA